MRVGPAGLEGVEHPHGEVGDHEEGDQLPPRLGLGLALAAREPEDRGHSLPRPPASTMAHLQEASRMKTVCSEACTSVSTEARNSAR